jgi:hypothetical protein
MGMRWGEWVRGVALSTMHCLGGSVHAVPTVRGGGGKGDTLTVLCTALAAVRRLQGR